MVIPVGYAALGTGDGCFSTLFNIESTEFAGFLHRDSFLGKGHSKRTTRVNIGT